MPAARPVTSTPNVSATTVAVSTALLAPQDLGAYGLEFGLGVRV